MKNALEMKIGGIKCDNDDCDFVDMSVKVEDYDKWLNKPCPKCGENLLTEDDYKNTQLILEIVKLTNNICPEVKDDKEVVSASISMNGTGELKFHINNIK